MLKRPGAFGDLCADDPWSPLDAAGLARVRTGADWILEHTGLEVHEHPETLERFAAAGARVSGNRVTFEPGQARAIARATLPERFVQRARNPARDVVFGDASGTITAPVAGAPMVHRRDGRRGYATQADHDDLARLAQQLEVIDHAGGGYCELTDHEPPVRHLHALAGMLRLTDKPVMGAARAPSQVADSLEMVRLLFGPERVARECCLVNLFNIESPLVLTAPTAEGMRLTAQAGQAAIVTSYAILGMNAPVTITAALPLMLAEVEAGLALVQLFAPGAPAVAGWYGVPFSMSAMRPAFGAVESMMVMAAGAQIMRSLGCPVRGDGAVTASKMADQQANADAARGLEIARMAGVDFALHAAGWLESGLVASREKFMQDAAAMGTLSDRESTGESTGERDWRTVLREHESPPMPAGKNEELDRFVSDRVRAYLTDDDAPG